MKRSLAVSAVLAILLTACAEPKGTPKATKASPSVSPSPSGVPSAAPSETEEQRHERERKELGFTPEDPPPSGFRSGTSGTPKPGALTLEVRFVPTCVELGQTLKLTARTNRPKVRVSFIGVMTDENGRAIEEDGTTDEKGLWNWEIKVPQRTSPHTYEMLGAAVDGDKQGDENQVLGSWQYVVAEPGRCA